MAERPTTRRLLETIETRLARLEAVAGTPVERYENDPDLQDIVERNFELAIQACIDLGVHLLADLPRPLPETNRAVFVVLVDEGLVPPELGSRLERMAGFRNLLAHEYAELVPRLVHENLGHLGDIREYIKTLLPRLRERNLLP